MSTKVEIPPLGESITEAVLLRWLKPEGAAVKADEALCELETDKANVELPSPAAGILRRIKKEGDSVKISEQVATIEQGLASASPSTKAVPAAALPGKPTPPSVKEGGNGRGAEAEDRLSPAVRAMVDENKLNPSELKGTGPGGRILKEDVMKFLETRGKTSVPKPAPTAPAPSTIGTVTALTVERPRAVVATAGDRREPMSKIRKKIAERLVNAQHQAAMLTTFNEVDMSAILDLRAKYKDRFNETYGVPLGMMSFFARAAVLALKAFPVVNAYIEGDEIVYHDSVNLGIAVSTDRGLLVPILHKADTMAFGRIEAEIKRMANASREGKLSLQELSGGTFTITNGGIFGSLLSTPILNTPQSAILGMHAIQKRPIAVGDNVVVRPMMYLAVSYDHRLIDGKDSVSFLVRIKQLLEDPSRLLLEI